jgi:hypothetical protein
LIDVVCQSAQQGFRTTEELHAESLAPINLLANQRNDLSISARGQRSLINGNLHLTSRRNMSAI